MDGRMVMLEEDDRLAASLRGFGPIGILSIPLILLPGNWMIGGVVAVPVSALLALMWARVSRTPWREIGYVPPTNWLVVLIGGATAGILFKLVMKMLVMPLLGADPINHAYHFLAGNRAMLPAAIWTMLMAGFGEETVFRGYLFERAGKLLGHRASAKAGTVLLTSGLFGAAHYADQGVAGVEQALITGLVFGTIFANTGRIFFLMCAHAAFDLTALAIIYWDLEYKAAHFILR
jgi:membrane protease YdiL (CAAX protease family)